MTLLPTILRRALVTATICAVFWFSVMPTRHSVTGTLAVIGGFLVVGLIIGLFLSWPPPIWVRVLIFFIFAMLIGLRNRPRHPERPFARPVTALVTAAPLGVLLLSVLAVDWVVARALVRRRGPGPT
jgi:hypothetical protein